MTLREWIKENPEMLDGKVEVSFNGHHQQSTHKTATIHITERKSRKK